MNIRTLALAVEAVIAGAPSTAAVIFGLPTMLSLGLATLLVNPTMGLWGLVQVIGCAWALVEFWRLAALTARSLPYTFGLRFWCAVLGALVGFVGFFPGIPLTALALLIGLPFVAAIHFVLLQLVARSAHVSQERKP